MTLPDVPTYIDLHVFLKLIIYIQTYNLGCVRVCSSKISMNLTIKITFTRTVIFHHLFWNVLHKHIYNNNLNNDTAQRQFQQKSILQLFYMYYSNNRKNQGSMFLFVYLMYDITIYIFISRKRNCITKWKIVYLWCVLSST